MAVQSEEHPSRKKRAYFEQVTLAEATKKLRKHYPPALRVKDPAAAAREARLAASIFLERAKTDAAFEHLANQWAVIAHVHGQDAVAQELQGLWTLTRKHLPILLDPQRNVIFNRLSLSMLVKRFYTTYPTAPRPSNLMGNTFLYAARADCAHEPAASSSGVKCKHCPGWFCF